MLQFPFNCYDETGGPKSTQGRKLSFQHTVHHGEISGKVLKEELEETMGRTLLSGLLTCRLIDSYLPYISEDHLPWDASNLGGLSPYVSTK